MSGVLLFHHAQGLTPGVHEFADRLRGAGHQVTVPDLYEGATFDTLADGIDHAQRVGFGAILERGQLAAQSAGDDVVYAGFSLGVLPAQMLAQTKPGAKGALLFQACVPIAEFGDRWPDGVPVQIHAMSGDQLFTDDGDLDAARDLVASVAAAELFLYPGDRHLFADSSLPDYDEGAATLLTQRALRFLDSLD